MFFFFLFVKQVRGKRHAQAHESWCFNAFCVVWFLLGFFFRSLYTNVSLNLFYNNKKVTIFAFNKIVLFLFYFENLQLLVLFSIRASTSTFAMRLSVSKIQLAYRRSNRNSQTTSKSWSKSNQHDHRVWRNQSRYTCTQIDGRTDEWAYIQVAPCIGREEIMCGSCHWSSQCVCLPLFCAVDSAVK